MSNRACAPLTFAPTPQHRDEQQDRRAVPEQRELAQLAVVDHGEDRHRDDADDDRDRLALHEVVAGRRPLPRACGASPSRSSAARGPRARAARRTSSGSTWRSGDAWSRARRSETMIEPRRHRRQFPVGGCDVDDRADRQAVELLHDRAHDRRRGLGAVAALLDHREHHVLRRRRRASCPTNHDVFCLPCTCAVPVLPAARPFGNPANADAAVPFASSTTPVSPARIVVAVRDRRRGRCRSPAGRGPCGRCAS